MKKLIILGLLGCLLALFVANVFAWELNLNGEVVWRYRFITRTGPNDIFGYMNGETGPNLGINHIRGYPTPSTNNTFADSLSVTGAYGVIAGEHNFGPDMGLTDFRITFYPTFKINKAIKLTCSVNLTSLGLHSNGRPYTNFEMNEGLGALDTVGGGYANSLWVPISDRPAGSNVPNTMVTVQWAKLGIKTPMLNFSLGYKTSGAGIGLWKNKKDRASTSFGMSTQYGPFTFGISPYFGRANSSWNAWPRNDRARDNPWRREGDRNYFGGITCSIIYMAGPMEINFAQDGWHTPNNADFSYGPRLANGTPGSFRIDRRPTPDTWVYDTVVGFKYANGRVFFNAEVAHFWEYNSGRGTTSFGTIIADLNQDAWIYGLETGVLAGPAKLTVSYVRATGDDPSTRITNEDARNGDAGVSPHAMRNWGYLMYYVYGTGTGWNAAGEGQSSNFHHVGARLDYAVAANLNTFAVVSYAWRDQENSFNFGGNFSFGARRLTNNQLIIQPPPPSVKAVPESAKDIGWEVDCGFDWKLLENLTWSTTFALWFPGKFWGYAYPNTAAMYAPLGNYWTFNPTVTRARINPDRTIDPLFAMETSLGVHF